MGTKSIETGIAVTNRVGKQLSGLSFSILVLAYCAWVFTLPLFPTQDGPVHLYYTSVLSHLFSGSELFAQYFSVRHPIPPYSLHYVLLFFLMKVFAPLIAEKIVVCLIIAGFCFGFRYLICSLAPASGPSLALFAVPLSLSWPLGMGFHNYCLALAFSFVSMTLWFRGARTNNNLFRAAFLISCVLMLFTHPVPLFMTLAVVVGELVLRIGKLYFSEGRSLGAVLATRSLRTDLMSAGLAFCSVAYIALFVSGSRTAENLHHKLIQGRMLLDFVKARPLILVFGNTWARLYRLFLFAALGCCLGVAFSSLRKRLCRMRFSGLQPSDVFVIAATLLLVLYPVIPRSVNGSDFFADRLVIYIWTFAIAGAAANVELRFEQKKIVERIASVVAIAVLAFSDKEFRLAAHNLERIEQAKLPSHGKRGMFINGPVGPSIALMNFDPYFWSSARYFRRTDSVMLNAPWLDLSILPVAPKNRLLANLFPPNILNRPDIFAETLLSSGKARDLINPELDFIIFVGYSSVRDPNSKHDLLKERWGRTWECQRDQWYAICSSAEPH